MGTDFAARAWPTLSILAFANALFSSAIVPSNLLNGCGHVRMNTAAALSSGVVVIVGCLLLLPLYGINGVALARLSNIPVTLTTRTVIVRRVLRYGSVWLGLLTLLPPILSFTPYLSLILLNLHNSPAFRIIAVLAGMLICWATSHLLSKQANREQLRLE
jgi:O-antigen/teichoic acid export membrane protein